MKTILGAALFLYAGLFTAITPTTGDVMEIETVIQFTDYGYVYTDVDEHGLSVHTMTFMTPVEIGPNHRRSLSLVTQSAPTHRLGL